MTEKHILLRDGSRTADRRLDRLVQFDERSRDFPVRTILPPTGLVSRSWSAGRVLDQQTEGSCVGMAWAKEGASYPVPVPGITNSVALSIYKQAQLLDEWPDDTPYEGTSTLAGAKALVRRGYMTGYRWCFSVEDVLRTLSSLGPVIIGIWWTDTMYETRRNGLVDIDGPDVGGHCIALTGIWPKRRFIGEAQPIDVVEWTNSWSPSYGIGGKGYLRFEDLATVLDREGEACVAIGRKYPSTR